MMKLARTMISTLTPSSKRVRVQRSTACGRTAGKAAVLLCCAVLAVWPHGSVAETNKERQK